MLTETIIMKRTEYLMAAKDVEPILTRRQLECLSWVQKGKSSPVIAEIMGIAAATVDEHVSEACRRLGVRTRIQAVMEAYKRGLID
ncbi:MAG: LuxR C-terminal-related transcriptional regulator [Allosphingosinicella sp.]|uniref:LuxR C-terminal-related transcriptional regulator n=1 Tax=Allosphingosinicella sp. TaxID=2823234 RepID=UPI00392CCE9C